MYHKLGDVVAWVSLAVAAAVTWMTRRKRAS
jgi:hypothetical protein